MAVMNVSFSDQLLKLGANPNAESTTGETALSFALREGTINVVGKLLAAGADVTRGDTLHSASKREPSEDTYGLIATLIHRGAPVDAYQWENGRAKTIRYGYPQSTALHIACKEGNYPAAGALLAFGADPRRLKKRGEQLAAPSPFDLTAPHSDMRRLLERYM
ncbi:Putative ankyrin repeat-containing domain superfamily [Septoria linicola]|uniref:Ankyrin repeat-containing domain superfamily n=1 Tax=Septoria linicola TaxID=215465 RepID=A0A9Q9ANU9_9PEZI|nr:Putative ankyrin repeat-containing domain superfamily [Septoria linicola]